MGTFFGPSTSKRNFQRPQLKNYVIKDFREKFIFFQKVVFHENLFILFEFWLHEKQEKNIKRQKIRNNREKCKILERKKVLEGFLIKSGHEGLKEKIIQIN